MARRDNGIAALRRRLTRIPNDVLKAVEPAILKSAEELASQMRNLAPVDDGDLRASIAVTAGGSMTPPYSQPGGAEIVPEGSAVVTAGNSGVRYPHLVEYGTADTEAQPFFWPAVRSGKKRATNRIKRAMRVAVREAGGKTSA